MGFGLMGMSFMKLGVVFLCNSGDNFMNNSFLNVVLEL